MPRGGRRPGAGRKVGSYGASRREVQARAALGMTPLDVMLWVMRYHYEAGRYDEAAGWARYAAPYVHARLAAVTVSGGATPVQLQIVEEIVDVAHAPATSNGESGSGLPR